MNRLAILPTSLLVLLMAGCTGYAPDAVRLGDRVEVRYDAVDGTGAPLVTGATESILVGSGASSLGPDGERALLGRRPNETFRVEVRYDPAEARFDVVAIAPPMIPDQPAEFEVARADYDAAKVGPAALGVEVPLGNGASAIVVAVTEESVRLRLKPGSRDIPALGLRLISELRGENLTQWVEPMVGQAFDLTQQVPGLDLELGTYRSLPMEEGQLRFARSLEAGKFPPLGTTVTFQITVVAPPEHGGATMESVSGQYGARISPHARQF